MNREKLQAALLVEEEGSLTQRLFACKPMERLIELRNLLPSTVNIIPTFSCVIHNTTHNVCK